MKKNSVLIIVIVLLLIDVVLVCFACQENNEKPAGTTYNPKPKNSVLSEEQRREAIDKKREALHGRLASDDYKNAVKLTIMVPKITEEFTDQSAELMASRMLQITAANGVAGYGGDPSFVFAGVISTMQKGITNTIPKKNYTKYNIGFYVANILTGDVFGAISQEITGVGDSDELACMNAVQSIENNDEMSSFIKESSKKIIDWYETNRATIITRINKHIQLEEYAQAYALLLSIPESATTCFAYAQKNIDDVYSKYRELLSSDYYYAMLDAMSKGELYNPVAGAYMRLIPHNSNIYTTAEKAFKDYVEHCKDVEDEKRAHEMYLDKENLAIERINAEANLKASEALIIQNQIEMERLSQTQTLEYGSQDQFKMGVINTITDKAVSLVSFGVNRLLGFLGLFI
jgi:hypothetical protein